MSENGHYLYTKNSKFNKKYKLTSPTIYPVSKLSKCSFRMWFYLSGESQNNYAYRLN